MREIAKKIIQSKEQTKTLVLAHYYDESEIQDIADHVGDSLYLAQVGQNSPQQKIYTLSLHDALLIGRASCRERV